MRCPKIYSNCHCYCRCYCLLHHRPVQHYRHRPVTVLSLRVTTVPLMSLPLATCRPPPEHYVPGSLAFIGAPLCRDAAGGVGTGGAFIPVYHEERLVTREPSGADRRGWRGVCVAVTTTPNASHSFLMRDLARIFTPSTI